MPPDPPDPPAPSAIRPGEHACCRFALTDDRERLAFDFVRDGLARGHKVIYRHDRDDPAAFLARLAAADARVAPAIESGQLELRPARAAYAPDGAFEVEQMLAQTRGERAKAFADGYPALSLTAEMSWALDGVPGSELVPEYEQRLAELLEAPDSTLVFLCQYDHGRFAVGTLQDVAEAHEVDVAPELAPIGRGGRLAAARVRPGPTLRLSGELDYACADGLATVLESHFHGRLRLDLSDLGFIDVAGLRALRGPRRQPLTIAGASEPVRRMLALLAWDTDPDIELLEAGA